MGATIGEIRFPDHAGIAGHGVHHRQDHQHSARLRRPALQSSFDKQTGFFTRSILCVPIINKHGEIIGVTQVLNKSGGPFTAEDEARLKAFTAQVAIALENAKLFDDVQKMKNYNESMLESMSNGVITLDEGDTIVTCNGAGARILRLAPADILGHSAAEFFAGENEWIIERIKKVQVEKTRRRRDGCRDRGRRPAGLGQPHRAALGERRRQATRHDADDRGHQQREAHEVHHGALHGPGDRRAHARQRRRGLLGGESTRATVLFSDIRGFTTLTEELGAQGTVAFLNEYFTLMVECIAHEEGMLDKFIGDAIMAAFGLPVAHDDDEDRAVRAAIAMIRECRRWSRERVQRGQKPVDMGIGLNTDMVVSGNIGSPKRMDYTVIGDGVNLASRLESACKSLFGADPDQREHIRPLARHLPHPRRRPRGGEGQDRAGRRLRGARLPHRGDLPQPDGCGELLQRRYAELPRSQFR